MQSATGVGVATDPVPLRARDSKRLEEMRTREFVKRLPNGPGVYRMFNEGGDVLYVGKARSLKKRVNNYAFGRGHSNRIAPGGATTGRVST